MQTNALYQGDNFDTCVAASPRPPSDLVAGVLENQALKRRLPQ